METCSRYLVGLLATVFIASATDNNSTSTEQTVDKEYYNTLPVVKDYLGLSTRRAITKKCLNEYSLTCLKMDLVKFMDRLATKETFKIIPGLSVVKNSVNLKMSSELPPWLFSDIANGKIDYTKKLDLYLVHRVEDFINSFTFRIEPDDPEVLRNIKNVGSEIVAVLSSPKNSRTGRSKKGALLWTAGVFAALGFAAMAALAGKALMASLLALMVSAISALRGGSSGLAGYKTAHYEIITKPVHYSAPPLTGPAHIYDHDHLHSSSYSPAYDYARTLSADSKMMTNFPEDSNYNNSNSSNNRDNGMIRTRLEQNKLTN